MASAGMSEGFLLAFLTMVHFTLSTLILSNLGGDACRSWEVWKSVGSRCGDSMECGLQYVKLHSVQLFLSKV